MARSTRTTWLKAVALVVALASLTINFGLIDLIDGYTGYIDRARNQVLDAGWGLVFGVILPLGLLAQLHRPERRIAGIQQTVVSPSRLSWRALRERHGGTLPSLPGSLAWVRCWFLSIRHERLSSRAGSTWTSSCSRSRPSPPFPPSATPGGWPRRNGTIFRPPMRCRTVCTTGL